MGARLANSEGFRVITLDGHDVGMLDHMRYERHMDHPDEIVVSRRTFFRERRATVPFDEIANVDTQRERVYLALPQNALEWSRESD